MFSNKWDKDDKYSERLWSLLCDCRKNDEEIDSLALRERDIKAFVNQNSCF